MNSHPRSILNMAFGLLLFLTCIAALLLSGCNRDKTSVNVNSPVVVTPSPSEDKRSTIKRKYAMVSIRTSGKSDFEPFDREEGEIHDGDLISTNDTGEAALKFPFCDEIYLYRNSALAKRPCPKTSGQSANVTTCAEEGTVSFDHCASNLVIQSESAEIKLRGTNVSITYLPKWQFTLLLVFEGTADLFPIKDIESRSVVESRAVERENFIFTVPDNRTAEIRRLNLGLEPRKAYPFNLLRKLLLNRALDIPDLRPVADHAIQRRDLPRELLDNFPPYKDNGDRVGLIDFSPSRPTKRESDLQFEVTKIGTGATTGFAMARGAEVIPSSILLDDPALAFKPVINNVSGQNHVTVQFSPKKPGTYKANLAYRDNLGQRYIRSVVGEAVAPKIEISPKFSSFDAQNKYLAKLTLTNKGRVPISIGAVKFESNAHGYFTKESDTCSKTGNKVDLKQQCEIWVKFNHPYSDETSFSFEKAKLRIEHDDPADDGIVELSGVISPSIEARGEINFSTTYVGAECEMTFWVINHGRPARMGAAYLSKPSFPESIEIVKDSCKDAVLIDRCPILLKFTPSSGLFASAELTIPDLTRNKEHKVYLSGAGKSAPIKVTQDSPFAAQKLGSAATIRTLTVSSTDTTSAPIQKRSIAGPGKDDFKIISETCTAKPPKDPCSIQVQFEPRAEGARMAEILLTMADPTTGGLSTLTQPISQASTPGTPGAAKDDVKSQMSLNSCADIRQPLEGKGEFGGFEVDTRSVCFKSKRTGKTKEPGEGRNVTIKSKQGNIDFSMIAELDGTHKDEFEIDPKACATVSGSCAIEVRFVPKRAKQSKALLKLRHDSGSEPVEVQLMGEGKSRWFIKRAAKSVIRFFGFNKSQCE